MDITVRLGTDPATAELIEEELAAALRRNVPPNDARPLSVVARDGEGRLAGGLIGSLSYGLLLVKALWVAEPARSRGLGSRLMAEAEAAARWRGCYGAWLDTSSARAEAFYLGFGYRPFGVLRNEAGEQPPGHRRAFLSKRLGPPGPPEADSP